MKVYKNKQNNKMNLNNLINAKEFNFETDKKLQKGKSPCYCHGDGLKCKTDAYWRLDDEEFCDKCLPIEGKILFFLNDWNKCDDKTLEWADEESDSSDEESDSSDEESDSE